MASITIDGVEIIISNGKARLSARSWQKANSSMWRAGSAQSKYASEYRAKANRIINSLNSTGSYVNSKGMRTYLNKGNDISKYGQFRQQAAPGTEAAKTQQRIESMGGLEPVSQADVIGQTIEMIEGMMEEVENISNDITQKAQEYFNKVSEITSNIGQSIADIFTD